MCGRVREGSRASIARTWTTSCTCLKQREIEEQRKEERAAQADARFVKAEMPRGCRSRTEGRRRSCRRSTPEARSHLPKDLQRAGSVHGPLEPSCGNCRRRKRIRQCKRVSGPGLGPLGARRRGPGRSADGSRARLSRGERRSIRPGGPSKPMTVPIVSWSSFKRVEGRSSAALGQRPRQGLPGAADGWPRPRTFRLVSQKGRRKHGVATTWSCSSSSRPGSMTG
jgi:hypothetical protein